MLRGMRTDALAIAPARERTGVGSRWRYTSRVDERPPDPPEQEAPDESPLEREELTLPDGRRLLLYSRREDG